MKSFPAISTRRKFLQLLLPIKEDPFLVLILHYPDREIWVRFTSLDQLLEGIEDAKALGFTVDHTVERVLERAKEIGE